MAPIERYMAGFVATVAGLLAVASNHMEMSVSRDAFIKDPSPCLPNLK